MSRITFSVSSEEHKLIKASAAMNGVTMKDYFLELHHANQYPDKETIEAIEELEDDRKRKNGKLKTYKNSEELWKDLGI